MKPEFDACGESREAVRLAAVIMMLYSRYLNIYLPYICIYMTRYDHRFSLISIYIRLYLTHYRRRPINPSKAFQSLRPMIIRIIWDVMSRGNVEMVVGIWLERYPLGFGMDTYRTWICTRIFGCSR